MSGTPAFVVGGPGSLDIKWNAPGGVSGSVKAVEENACGKDSSLLVVDIYDPPVVSFVGFLKKAIYPDPDLLRRK